ncbi:MAG: VWA domain-containing protein [Candidatus Omnitrophota bacterium]
MKFAAAYMAVWLWLIPALIGFYIFSSRSRTKTMERFAEKRMLRELSKSFDEAKRNIKKWIIIIAVLFITVAFTRPQWGFQWQEIKRQGLDILIALDTSNSMLAEDVLPNRLERAKLAIKDLVKKLQADRIGLIAFSGSAFLQCPLTVDYNGFLLSLDDVDTLTIPLGGTSLSKVIYNAVKSYEGAKGSEKILIVITDGEDLDGGVEKAIDKAKTEGVKIFCVGIGSSNGELVPITDSAGKKVFLKDSEGNVVKTRLVEEHLRNMALKTGGMYVRSRGAEFGLDLIYNEKLSKLEKQEFKSKREKRYHERFQFPLLFAFVLLLIEPLIGDRKRL